MRPTAKEISDMHDALVAWLTATYPHANPLAIVTMLTYELGRIVRLSGATVADRESALADVIKIMRIHMVDGPPI